MSDPQLEEEDRLLKFLQEDRKTQVPPDLFSTRAIDGLKTYQLIETLENDHYILTKKGEYVRRMISNPRIEREKKGNAVLNFKLKQEHRVSAFQFLTLFSLEVVSWMARSIGLKSYVNRTRVSSHQVLKSFEETTEELVFDNDGKSVSG